MAEQTKETEPEITDLSGEIEELDADEAKEIVGGAHVTSITTMTNPTLVVHSEAPGELLPAV